MKDTNGNRDLEKEYDMNHEKNTQNAQLLTFTLDEEVFAVEIAKVREVLDLIKVTRVPKMPEFMRGVINLRGAVVPIVDMRIKFGLSRADEGVHTCIIVLETEVDGEPVVIGALADSVREVLELRAEDIEPPPRMGTRLKSEFIKGMGKQDDSSFIIILDIDRIFSTEEMSLFQTVGESPAEDTSQLEAQCAA